MKPRDVYLVVVTKVTLHGDGDLADVTQVRAGDAVERCRSVHSWHESRGCQGQGTSHAEASDPHLGAAPLPQVPDARLDVFDGTRPVQVAHQVVGVFVVRRHLLRCNEASAVTWVKNVKHKK